MDIRFCWIALLFSALLMACSGDRVAQTLAAHVAECAPMPPLPAYSAEPLEPIGPVFRDSLLINRFSNTALATASVCRLLPALRELVRAEQRGGSTAPARQRIDERLTVATLELASVAAELDCHEETADQVADYLAEEKNSRTRTLTLMSILIGAFGGVLTSVMALRNVGKQTIKYSAIGFGLLGAGIGLTSLTSNQQVTIRHERNPLRDVLDGPTNSAYFPPLVWAYLNQPNARNPKNRSIRQHLLSRWAAFEGVTKTADRNKLVGAAGDYTADQLHRRANLFDQLESEVNLMYYDLQRLVRETNARSSR